MSGLKAKGPMTVSREDLFGQVWAEPMSLLARQYGISGRGLAKVCDRLKVPYPSRGWWARKAAGRKVAYFQLPEADADTPQTTHITPTEPPPVIPPEMREKAAQAAIKAGEVVVPTLLRNPHPIIAGWQAEYERQQQAARWDRNPSTRDLANTWTPLDRRQHRILDALFKAAERLGATAKEDRRSAYLEVAGGRIDFTLCEKLHQVRRPKTEDEKRSSAPTSRDWTYDRIPTGRLSFSLDTALKILPQRVWVETAEEPLEDSVGEILAAFLLAGALLAEQRRALEDAERVRREAEHRRYQEAERQRRDDTRWRRFLELAEQRRQLDDARRFLVLLETRATPGDTASNGQPIADLLAWVRRRLARFDPLDKGVASVFDDVLRMEPWMYRDERR